MPDSMIQGEPLTLNHQGEIEAFLGPLRTGLSEYSFPNLYLFRHIHNYRYQPAKLPCIAGATYNGCRHLLPLFDLASAPGDQLLERLTGYDCYFPVSQQVIDRLDTTGLIVEAERADADYLYPIENFLHYRGKRLSKKRNQMRQFLRQGSHRDVCFDNTVANDALSVLLAWQTEKGKPNKETDWDACREAVTLSSALGLYGYIYYLDDKPVGFLLGEEVAVGVFVIHFAKGRVEAPGIYPYMFHHLSGQIADRFTWINFEQDLGLSNFRRNKISYAPHSLLPKYRLFRTESSGCGLKHN
ncbi:MAG: phosphatidylglycerol lysyltransferase domain-containing protein [Geobacteraceae bacterium]